MANQGVQIKFWGVQNTIMMKIPIEMKELRWFKGVQLDQLPVQNTRVHGWLANTMGWTRSQPIREDITYVASSLIG